MKSTGIVRKVDELGRVVLPMELRRTLDIHVKDSVEIFVDADMIILQKYTANMACAITDEITNRNRTFNDGKLVLSPRGAEMLVNEIKSKFPMNV